MKRKRLKMTLAGRQAMTGRLFVLPFYIGFILFFLVPIVQSIVFAFSKVTLDVGAYHTEFVGLENIRYIFNDDLNYTFNLQNSVIQLLWQLPVIILLSLFIALILNSRFKGRTLVRAIFFLPVIAVTGTIVTILQSDTAAANVLAGNVVSSGMIEYSTGIEDFLVRAGLGRQIVDFLTRMSDTIFNLLWKTGVQMIIFLAGLQSISPALYEASAIEGATAWENFFKITVPMMVPIITLNVVYTIVDFFIDSNNLVMNQVIQNSSALRLDRSAAMAWVYFLIVGVILAAVMAVFAQINKRLT